MSKLILASLPIQHVFNKRNFSLAPQLQAAKDAGEDAKTLSVLGAGFGGPIDVNDLGLKKGFSVRAAASHGITYNDCMNEVSTLHTTC
jgi:hypothetical protein